MSKNDNLRRAKAARQDEFYTQLTDIEHELKHYREHFRDKVVFCNCDDPEYSNFWRYFNNNFEFLGLRRLVATHYEGEGPSYMLEMYRDENGVHSDIKTLQGNGDFRSDECIALLKQSDIVVTNPPFSLFREFITQLFHYEKAFLIIGNKNAVSYKNVFPLLKENKMWLGYNAGNGSMYFSNQINGQATKSVPSYWYTNLDIQKRHEALILYKRFSPEEYPRYDNYDAIEVSTVKEIPMDYEGVMGVPVSFVNKHSPTQFQILGVSEQCGVGLSDGLWHADCKIKHPLINGRKIYSRLFIQRKDGICNEN